MAEKTQFGHDLAEAILERNEDKAESLLSQNANLSFVLKGDMPIHLATRYGLLRTIKNLIKYGDNVNRPNEHENTAIHFAAREGMEDIVTFLISKGANINTQNWEGNTPLHLAVSKQSMDVIERYVHLGMDVNIQNKQGDTPLHSAAAYGRDESVEALLLSGADPDIRNKNGKRAEDTARSPELRELIRGFKLLSSFTESGFIRSQGLQLGHNDVTEPRRIERVDLTVEKIDLPTDFPTTFYFRREFSENASVALTTGAEDEIASDVYHIRVKDGYRELTTRVTVPVYRPPSNRESMSVQLLHGDQGRELVTDVFEKDQGHYCSLDVVLVPETTAVLVIVIFPRAEEAKVGPESQVLSSDDSPGFELSIPEGSFFENTMINLKVFEPVPPAVDDGPSGSDENDSDEEYSKTAGHHGATPTLPGSPKALETVKERPNELGEGEAAIQGDGESYASDGHVNSYKNLVSDVYEVIIAGEQPSKEITLQIPLKEPPSQCDVDNIQIVRVNTDQPVTKDSALPIEELTKGVAIVGNNVQVDVNHFCILSIVWKKSVADKFDDIYKEIMNSKERRKEARFFAVVRSVPGEVGKFQLVVECGKAEGAKKRRNRWKEKGFEKQSPRHSSKILLSPSQDFYIGMLGDLQFDTDIGEAGLRKLTFYTSRASYQPYQVCLTPTARKGVAHVIVHTVNNCDSPGTSAVKSEVTRLKIRVQLPRRRSSIPEAPSNVPKRPQSTKDEQNYSKGEKYPSTIILQ